MIRVIKQHQASAAQLFIPDWHPNLAQGHWSRNSRTKEEEQKVGKLTPRDKQPGSEGEVKNMSNRELCTSNWTIRLNWTNPVTNRLLIGWPPHATEKPHRSVLFHLSPLSCSHPGSSACRCLIWAELMQSASNRKGFNHTGWLLTHGRTPPTTPHTDHLHSLSAHRLSALKLRSKVVNLSWAGAVYFLVMGVLVSFTGQSAYCLPEDMYQLVTTHLTIQ